jgi:hypothetical protein
MFRFFSRRRRQRDIAQLVEDEGLGRVLRDLGAIAHKRRLFITTRYLRLAGAATVADARYLTVINGGKAQAAGQ